VNQPIAAKPHPKGVWSLIFVAAFNMFGFGYLLANLMQYFHTLQVSIVQATILFAVFISILYALPLIGGYLADRFGFRIAVSTGISLSLLGSLCIAIPHLFAIEFGLSLYAVGACLSAATLTGLIGLQYKHIPYKRESGLSWFYAIFNGAYLIAGILGALLVKHISYHLTMLIFAGTSTFALLLFAAIQKNINEMHEGSIKKPSTIIMYYGAYIVFGVCICFAAFQKPIIDSILFWVILIASFAYLMLLAQQSTKHSERNKIWVFAILCLIGVAYNVIYNTEFELLPYFFSSSFNPHIGSFVMPNDLVVPMDPVYCVILAPILGTLWAWLARHKKDLALPTKFAWGLIFAALGYLLLATVLSYSMNHRLPVYWLFLTFLLFVAGELLVVPIAYAMAPKLAPHGKVGIFSAIWTVMNGFSAVIGGYIASNLAVNLHASLFIRNTHYRSTFFVLSAIVLLLGLLTLVVIGPKLKKMLIEE
jgi:proton-dependent oligopeptide transporter, POT family